MAENSPCFPVCKCKGFIKIAGLCLQDNPKQIKGSDSQTFENVRVDTDSTVKEVYEPMRGILVHTPSCQEAVNPYWNVTQHVATLQSLNKQWRKWVYLKKTNGFLKLMKKVKFSKEKPEIFYVEKISYHSDYTDAIMEDTQT